MYLWKLLDKLKDYKLTQVAGFEGLNRNIRWFHIAEDETLSNFIIGDELVFTTGVKMNGNSVALLGFVKAMLKYGAGGIVINTGKYINERIFVMQTDFLFLRCHGKSGLLMLERHQVQLF